MSECAVCTLAASKAGLVYQDDAVVALAHPAPATPGHLLVVPRQHATIFEQLPDEAAARLFRVANTLAGVAFDALPGLGGTNLVVQNGLAAGQPEGMPHAAVHVIPRKEGDGLAFEPPRRQLGDEDMAKIEEQLRALVEKLAAVEPPAETPKPAVAEEPKQQEKGGDDWVREQLHKLP